MARYASGARSKAICDISGFETPYKELRTTWKGLRVSPEEFDVKQPQLTPVKNIKVTSGLYKARPDNDSESVVFKVGYNYNIFLNKNQIKSIGISSVGSVGFISVVIE
jgi:hypothetical protein|tara:strand:+ start:130 stop:453 length:324 start_codon:yes stop_codon:yes gene_type:complete